MLCVVPCLDFSIFSQITSSLSFFFPFCSLNKDVCHIGFLLLPKSFVQGFSLGHLPPKCNHHTIRFLFVKSFDTNLSSCLWVSVFFFFSQSLWISAFITRKLKRYALYPFDYSLIISGISLSWPYLIINYASLSLLHSLLSFMFSHFL